MGTTIKKQTRKIKYPDTYNPIYEYWDTIKYKPLYAAIEKISLEIEDLKVKDPVNTRAADALQEQLDKADQELLEAQATGATVNTSQKVYRIYKEIVRLLGDPESEWEYSPAKANHAIEFIENYCRHSKGKMGGKPFILELWQKAIVAATFGIVHKITGLRKYTEVLLMVARKNGKSTFSAAVGLYLQIADNEPGAEIYAVATKKDQAKIIWLELLEALNSND